MIVMTREAWEALSPEGQQAAVNAGMTPPSEPWIDAAYERLTGKRVERPADGKERE